MDIANSLRRYLILKNNLIPSTQNRIKELGREIFQAEATLNAISDEKVFLEDFKWEIRTRELGIKNAPSSQKSAKKSGRKNAE